MNSADSPLEVPATRPAEESLAFAVLKQFRLIYGSVKQHFREIEQSCGVSGSQLWLLHEIARTPGVGVSELAGRLSIHQSTCSQLVDKLETRGLVNKRRKPEDQRRVGLQLSDGARDVLQAAPGPAEGILPEALQGLSEEELLHLQAGLASVIGQLKTRDERSVDKPLADL